MFLFYNTNFLIFTFAFPQAFVQLEKHMKISVLNHPPYQNSTRRGLYWNL